jgi:hypothetical protein
MIRRRIWTMHDDPSRSSSPMVFHARLLVAQATYAMLLDPSARSLAKRKAVTELAKMLHAIDGKRCRRVGRS